MQVLTLKSLKISRLPTSIKNVDDASSDWYLALGVGEFLPKIPKIVRRIEGQVGVENGSKPIPQFSNIRAIKKIGDWWTQFPADNCYK